MSTLGLSAGIEEALCEGRGEAVEKWQALIYTLRTHIGQVPEDELVPMALNRVMSVQYESHAYRAASGHTVTFI